MKKIIFTIIALALSISQFYQSKNACMTDTVNSFSSKYKTFIGFSWGHDQWTKNVAPICRNRMFSGMTAAWYCDFFKDTVNGFKGHPVEAKPININGKLHRIIDMQPIKLFDAIASWNAGWMLLTLLLIVFIVKKNTLLWIFGMSAGILFAWTPAARGIIYPYDGPIMFLWVLVVLLGMSQKYRYWIFPIIMIGTGFKETIIVCSLIPFLWFDIPLKQRIKWFIICGTSACFVKLFLSLIAETTPFFTMQTKDILTKNFHGDPNCKLAFIKNVQALIHLRLDYPLFAIGGMLIALFLLPNKKIIVGWKIISGLFVFNIMIFGIITEYRLWHELVPVFLWCWTEGVNNGISPRA